MTAIKTDILCGCGKEIIVEISSEKSATEESDEFIFYCNSKQSQRKSICEDFVGQIDFLEQRVNEFLRVRKIRLLLRKKEKLLFKFGLFSRKKKVNSLHKQINHQLEILGVYQGKFRRR